MTKAQIEKLICKAINGNRELSKLAWEAHGAETRDGETYIKIYGTDGLAVYTVRVQNVMG